MRYCSRNLGCGSAVCSNESKVWLFKEIAEHEMEHLENDGNNSF